MEIGIARCGLVIPRYRLTAEQVKEAWGSRGRTSAKCFHDEDVVTLATEAALRAAGDGLQDIDALVVATVSAPFAERSTAAQVAGACNGTPPLCVDLGGTRRASASSFSLASALLKSGQARNALLIGADARQGELGTALEWSLGAGACAFVLTSNNPAAVIIGSSSLFGDCLESWRRDGERAVHADAGRAGLTEGVVSPMATVIKEALAAANVGGDAVTHLALGVANAKAAAAVAKATGIARSSVVDPTVDNIGDLGNAGALTALAAALERARPNDVIVMAAAGDGADAVVLRAGDSVAAARPTPSVQTVVGFGRPVPSYPRLLAWQGQVGAPDEPSVGSILINQDAPMLSRLQGYHCSGCGLVAYPVAAICQKCQGRDVRPVRLQRTGTVFTFTRDRLYGGVEPEIAMLVVDLDGGGRVLVQGTDSDPAEFSIGRSVELVYRKVHEGDGHPQYYWKARLRTEGASA